MCISIRPSPVNADTLDTPAARRIVASNRAATRVLAALMIHGRRGRAGITPDFSVLEALLAYTDRTVRGVHFAIEESCLAAPLSGLRADLRSKLAQLRRDHIGTGGYCSRMREAIALWRKGAPTAIGQYLENARDHHRLSVAHGRLLRGTILPAAQACFSPSNWQQVEMAFAKFAADPLTGCVTRTEFDSAVTRLAAPSVP